MIIEHADRFGLAQLHQLRGRVGRGAAQSVCLPASTALSETARERLALMRETNDGFVIAEKDLELRGGGELLGLKQSGDADYRLATPEQLVRLLPVAHDDARLFVERDGGLNGVRGMRCASASICLNAMLRCRCSGVGEIPIRSCRAKSRHPSTLRNAEEPLDFARGERHFWDYWSVRTPSALISGR